MSDLDLARIRNYLASVRFASGIGPILTRTVHEYVPALLAEVERLTKQLAEANITIRAFVGESDPSGRHHCQFEADVEEQGFDIVGLRCELADSSAEVERLKANQLPDDGEWTWQYGFYLDGDFVHHGDEGQTRRIARFAKKPIMRRQVRYGRVEPAPPQSDSAASDPRPESTTDQTAPQTP